MNFFKIAALAAVVVSGSAMAVFPQFPNHNGPDSTMKVYQQGAGNNVNALQADARDSLVDVKQYGVSNGASIGQGADDSSITLLQDGFGNNATIGQWDAKDSTIDVKQYGGLNGATVSQTAGDSSITLTQAGFNNHANLQQH